MNQSIVSKILKSAFFANILSKAGGIAKNKVVLLTLIQQVVSKIEAKGMEEGLKEVLGKVKMLVRFLKAYATGAYREVPMKSVVIIIGVLVYFVSPLDLIPDVLPIIGITDDVALVVWLFKTLEAELTKFADWEGDSTINIS